MPRHAAGQLSTDDIIAIQQLNARYVVAIDDLVPSSAAVWANTFTPDGSFTLRDSAGHIQVHAKGTAQLKAQCVKFPDRANTRHWFTNLLIEPDDEGVRMTCYLISLDTKPTSPAAAAIARTGVYRDILRKLNGNWKFTTREVTLDAGSSG
ncbi:MAG: nuclear transport factor 2 family protein [Acetobacteraceae bacterium]|jgi:hypothetical protein